MKASKALRLIQKLCKLQIKVLALEITADETEEAVTYVSDRILALASGYDEIGHRAARRDLREFRKNLISDYTTKKAANNGVVSHGTAEIDEAAFARP